MSIPTISTMTTVKTKGYHGDCRLAGRSSSDRLALMPNGEPVHQPDSPAGARFVELGPSNKMVGHVPKYDKLTP